MSNTTKNHSLLPLRNVSCVLSCKRGSMAVLLSEPFIETLAATALDEQQALCCMQVSHDDKGVTSVSFLEGVDVRRPGRVADLLARAMRQRAVGATATNEHSSRSHMVFTLAITGTNAASGQEVHGGLHPSTKLSVLLGGLPGASDCIVMPVFQTVCCIEWPAALKQVPVIVLSCMR